MTEDRPIPEAAFAAAIERLDATTLAAFVGALRAETADEVTVDPPRVVVHDGGVRTELAVAGDGREIPANVDAVVASAEGVDAAAGGVDAAPRVVTPSDLRRRVLYGVPREAADALCDRYLGTPARGAYEPPGDGGTARGDSQPPDASPSTPPATTHSDASAEAPPHPGDGDEAGGSSTLDWRPWLVAAAAVCVLLVAAGSGLPTAGDGPSPGVDDASAGAMATETVETTRTPSAATTGVGGDSGEGDRNVGLEPTCTRSPLLVVQIQVNALKHDDGTDDGIRTVRRFASPGNRRAVGSVEAYASLVQSETYAPLLSWDRVEFAPRGIDGRTATIRVVTAAEGEVTGRFEFRLGRQDGGVHDGCWMTESVRSLTFDRSP